MMSQAVNCNKCGGIHAKNETISDRDEFKLIERLEQIRQTHQIKVDTLNHDYIGDGEMHEAKITYLDMEEQ